MAKNMKFDFAGYATKNNLLCSDGRTIRQNAFASCDGKTVPLVWNHGGRTDPSEVLGHALLENRSDGVYMYGTFNNTEKAQIAKECVKNGDITGLSIFANSLKQKAGDVLHGIIREVSLVLSGANPGATIDFVMQHDSDSLDSFFYYLSGEECELMHKEYDEYDEEIEHADNEADGKSVEEVLETLTDEQKAAVAVLLDALTGNEENEESEELEEVKHADEPEKPEEQETPEETKEESAEEEVKHADEPKEEKKDDEEGESVEAILNTLNDKQKAAVAMMIETITGESADDDENEDEEKDMKHNAFEENNVTTRGDIRGLMKASIDDISRYGSLKKSVLAHAEEFGYTDDEITDGYIAHAYPKNEANEDVTYGMADIEYLFPEARSLNTPPAFIKRKDDWVTVFMNAVHKTPFSRVKSMFANITADEARAKGYVKGARKEEEVFTLLKRSTDPQTIYKKQKLDRDDILDITDFSVVSWVKDEMRVMMNEEIARACLVGDGRSNASADKISELHIRPIYTDDSLFSIKVPVVVPSDHTDDDDAREFIKSVIRARKDYRGSGSPILFTTADMLTSMLLLEDGIGRALYSNESELAAKLRVSRIVEVPVMENLTRTANNKTFYLAGIIVNPADYNTGTDKGGQLSFFEDFDIDYNQEKYLLETRLSGALVVPYSAMILELDPTGAAAHS